MGARRDELTDAAADAAIDQACRIPRLPAIRARGVGKKHIREEPANGKSNPPPSEFTIQVNHLADWIVDQIGGFRDHPVRSVGRAGMVLQCPDGLDEPAVVASAAGGGLNRAESPPRCSSANSVATRSPYCLAHPLADPALLRVSNSSSDNSIPAAATFSSKCATFDVPGIGSITGERFSNHASASCDGVAW